MTPYQFAVWKRRTAKERQYRAKMREEMISEINKRLWRR